MPTPNAVPVLTDYLSLGYNFGEDQARWRKLTVSRAGAPRWLTIGWDEDPWDPKGQHYDAGGWTILAGPCSYSLRAHARCKGLEPNCATHIQGVVMTRNADGTQTLAGADEATERPVMPYETSHTHIDGPLVGYLRTGQLLQVRIDYWNAGRFPDGTLEPQDQVFGWLVGASVRGFWGPLPADMT